MPIYLLKVILDSYNKFTTEKIWVLFFVNKTYRKSHLND